MHDVVSGIFRAWCQDRLIVSNPCEGTRLPRLTKARVEPLPIETVRAIEPALPARYRALVTLAVGTGMRQGECLGLTVDRVDFLRRTVRADQQLVTAPGREPFLAPPKDLCERVGHPATADRARRFSGAPGGVPGWRLVFVNERAAGAPDGTGFHVLRHLYASLLIRHGESVKVVQARLGARECGGDARHLLAPVAGQ